MIKSDGKYEECECREYDIPRTAEIEKYMALSREEREKLIAEEMERLRKQWVLDDAKEQLHRQDG